MKHEEAAHTVENNFESKAHGILNLSFSISISAHVLWVPGKTVPRKIFKIWPEVLNMHSPKTKSIQLNLEANNYLEFYHLKA